MMLKKLTLKYISTLKSISPRRFGAAVATVVAVTVLSGSVMTKGTKDAEALCTPCQFCLPIDTPITVFVLDLLEDAFWTPMIEDNIEDHLYEEANWIMGEFFEDFWVKGLAELTEYLTVVGMHQMVMIGSFFDANNQIETVRLFSKLRAEAHKDYHPSQDFCYFGTNARSLAASDVKSRLTMAALSDRYLQRQLGYENSVSSATSNGDKAARWRQFVTSYCDPKDNNWYKPGSGLDFACDRDGPNGSPAAGATDRSRVNKDIDYTGTIDAPRTLNADFTDQHTTSDPMPDTEQDILAMSSNLYGHTLPSRTLGYGDLKTSTAAQRLYLELRGVAAKRSVAVHSFNNIVALKSAGSNGDSTASSQPNVARFMGAVIAELMPEPASATEASQLSADIYKLIGENPSYYAQMEILAKKIYQNPNFFANLYDKPANVERKKVAMKAIELMLDRELLESELRQEMMLSVMLSGKLNPRARTVERNLALE